MVEKDDLLTIRDFQRDMISNSDRWFPNAYETLASQVQVNVLGIAGEAGEVADVYKKFVRGSLTEEQMNEQLAEECIDLMHYLFQLLHVLDVDIAQAYIDKSAFNEERFGCGE